MSRSASSRWLAAVAFVLASAAGAAQACGFCDEDRIAAVFDAAHVQGALARHRQVAFFGIEGSAGTGSATRRAVVAALEAGGGVRGTSRVALDGNACAVAFDPAKTDAKTIGAAATRALAGRGLSLTALRITDAKGALREP